MTSSQQPQQAPSFPSFALTLATNGQSSRSQLLMMGSLAHRPPLDYQMSIGPTISKGLARQREQVRVGEVQDSEARLSTLQ